MSLVLLFISSLVKIKSKTSFFVFSKIYLLLSHLCILHFSSCIYYLSSLLFDFALKGFARNGEFQIFLRFCMKNFVPSRVYYSLCMCRYVDIRILYFDISSDIFPVPCE